MAQVNSDTTQHSVVRLLTREQAELEDLCSGIPRHRRSVWRLPSSCDKSPMATMLLPPEFKRLLSTLASNEVDYLIVGGYAVIFSWVCPYHRRPGHLGGTQP